MQAQDVDSWNGCKGIHGGSRGNREPSGENYRSFPCNTICDKDGNVIVKANHMITPKRAAKVMAEGVDENR